MAKAYRCDRCRSFQTGDPASVVLVGIESPDWDEPLVEEAWNEMHLCESCEHQMERFMELREADDLA